MTPDNQIAAGAGVGDANRPPVTATEEIARFLEETPRREGQAAEPCWLYTMPLTRLIGYLIDRHHVYARRQLAVIESLLAGLSAAEEKRLPELARVRGLFKVFRQELLFHMEKEEVSLFPRIIRTETSPLAPCTQAAPDFGTMRDPVRMLMHEHDELCAMLDRMRAATNDYTPPEGACADYRLLCRALRDLEIDLLQLTHVEDSILFPRALDLETTRRAEISPTSVP